MKAKTEQTQLSTQRITGTLFICRNNTDGTDSSPRVRSEHSVEPFGTAASKVLIQNTWEMWQDNHKLQRRI